jgi:hypothetical protein
MLGGRNRWELTFDVLVIVGALVRVLGGLDTPKRSRELRCDERPKASKTWELRRLPPCEVPDEDR